MTPAKSYLISCVVILFTLISSLAANDASSSFDSLVASQCRARCLAHYPWKASASNSTASNDRRHRSMWDSIFPNIRVQRMAESADFEVHNHTRQHHSNKKRSKPQQNIKWKKVMEMCAKNPNCLQCSLPCDIPTNLLSNCKFLCKNNHPLCIESCDLLIKLNEEKHGSCPAINKLKLDAPVGAQGSKCTNQSKSAAIAYVLSRDRPEEARVGDLDEAVAFGQCNRDSDCLDIQKCCPLNPECPEHGNFCQKPNINNIDLPSIPFNLTIVERKKGKTVILSWNSNYNKKKPTMFVVEGRWSLKSPLSALSSAAASGESTMTKWGYLAQTVNTNRVILRSINRGRWYKFRVAAISKSGTYGFSKPTELFILSTPPKPPTSPQNLSIAHVLTASAAPGDAKLVDVEVSWLPPKRSDLPVVSYRISWYHKLDQAIERVPGGLAKRSNDYERGDYDNQNADYSNPAHDENDYSTDDVAEYTEAAKRHEMVLKGSDVVDVQTQSNKYRIRNLQKGLNYIVELVAESKYDDKTLTSSPQRLQILTDKLAPIDQSSAAYDSQSAAEPKSSESAALKNSSNDNYDDRSNENEEDDVDTVQKHLEERPEEEKLVAANSQPIITRNSPLRADDSYLNQIRKTEKRQLLRNLSVQTPTYHNGGVKAKLSWLLENANPADQDEPLLPMRRPMFTITWFAIKCTDPDSEPDAQRPVTLPQQELPTPITATTIDLGFEIYELKYNCDYVVNVRMTTPNRLGSSSVVSVGTPPQVASAQFKVPSCSKIRARTRPPCASYTIVRAETDQTRDRPTPQSASVVVIENAMAKSTMSSTVPSTEGLPRVANIRYRIVDKSPLSKLYSVEFSWSLPISFNRNLINGYQITIIPKASTSASQQSDDDSYMPVGSVGAIVERDQSSFVIRQLRANIRYLFQIQIIGRDNQSYGPASSVEFKINEEARSESSRGNGGGSDELMANVFKISSSSGKASNKLRVSQTPTRPQYQLSRNENEPESYENLGSLENSDTNENQRSSDYQVPPPPETANGALRQSISLLVITLVQIVLVLALSL